MTYRVSTSRSGEPRWWVPRDEIPETDTDVREATPAETAVMDRIVNARGMPPLALGERIGKLLREYQAAARRE